jgi:hypothetical protein
VPASPKRAAMLIAVWVAALGLGGAVAYALNLLNPVVTSLRVVREMTPFPVLGVVGVAFPSRLRQEFRRHVWQFSAASAGLIAAFALVLALNAAGFRLAVEAIHEVAKT